MIVQVIAAVVLVVLLVVFVLAVLPGRHDPPPVAFVDSKRSRAE